MPDWQKLVGQRLAGLALGAAEKQEIYTELAGHLEESYECLRAEGLADQEAIHRTLAQVADWRDLQRRIIIAKKTEDPMQNRLHQLWIPGFLTLTLSTIFLMTLQIHGYQPRIISWNGPDTILLYVPWLLSLPLFGGLGAYLSQRAGSPGSRVLLASIFPVLSLAACLFVILPVSFIVDAHVEHRIRMASFLRSFFEWVLVPGAALLAGGLPVQFFLSRRLASRRTAVD
ncbi:MAG: hypothetical protein AUH86_23255 [Acidobacteria bacterium 13_1_40CM_4_58_4]|nr:MAG: hypothetical protein AUH86_23255 [Acidobacteria bacterium 13_1_40CM_4_58_4]